MAKDKRKAFAWEYIIDHNATQAAIRAGYSESTAKSTGQRLLTFADVEAEIAELEARRKSECIASADEVDEFLTAGMRGELDEEELITIQSGHGHSEVKHMRKQISMRDRIQCARERARRMERIERINGAENAAGNADKPVIYLPDNGR